MYVENRYCAKPRCAPIVIPESILRNNQFSSAIASMFGQSGYNADNLASDDEEYTIAKNVAATPPRQSKRTANLLTV